MWKFFVCFLFRSSVCDDNLVLIWQFKFEAKANFRKWKLIVHAYFILLVHDWQIVGQWIMTNSCKYKKKQRFAHTHTHKPKHSYMTSKRYTAHLQYSHVKAFLTHLIFFYLQFTPITRVDLVYLYWIDTRKPKSTEFTQFSLQFYCYLSVYKRKKNVFPPFSNTKIILLFY